MAKLGENTSKSNGNGSGSSVVPNYVGGGQQRVAPSLSAGGSKATAGDFSQRPGLNTNTQTGGSGVQPNYVGGGQTRVNPKPSLEDSPTANNFDQSNAGQYTNRIQPNYVGGGQQRVAPRSLSNGGGQQLDTPRQGNTSTSNPPASSVQPNYVGGGQQRIGDESPSTSKAPVSAAELKNAEKEAGAADENPMNYQPSKDTGSGKQSKLTKQQGLMAKLNKSGNSKLKKRVALAGAAAGGSVIVSIIIFLALLPLKIEHVVTNLEAKFAATSQSAVESETENLFEGYVQGAILTSIAAGKCHSTIDPSCTVIARGTGPVGRLYAAWSKGRLENKLATKYGLVFGKNADGKFVMNLNGKDIDLTKVRSGELSLFDLPDTKQYSRKEIRAAVKEAFKGATLWDKTYTRFKVGTFLDKQFGIRRYVIARDTRDTFSDSVIDKKLAAKAYLLQRLVPAKYSVVMGCLLQPALCQDTLGDAAPGEDRRLTPAQEQVKQILGSAADHFSEDRLKTLAKNSNDIAKDGFAKVFTREAVKSLVSATGASEATIEAAGSRAENAVPVIGWSLLAVQLVALGSEIGPLVQHVGYAVNSASAVEMYSTYNTVASEAKSGHVDPTELGSFTQALTTNLSGSTSDQADVTSTPLYNSLVENPGGGTTASVFSSLFGSLLGGSAYADSASTSAYKCNDGSSVPAGKLVCPEENFTTGNAVANNVSSFINSIPVLPAVAKALNAVVSGAVSAVFSALNKGCTSDFSPLKYAGCPQMESAIGNFAGGIANWVGKKLVVSAFSDNMSGGRTGDMIAAGADVAQNQACQAELGCGIVSNEAVATARNQQLTEAKQQFDSESMFARIFDTDSSYSLVSRLAVTMPTNLTGATTSVSSTILSNPLKSLGDAFSSIFTGNRALATTTAQADPFGVPQYGYTPSEIPKDPETFWNQNCINGQYGTYDDATGQFDASSWLNANQTLDPVTGEAANTAVNPCLLIQSSIQVSGGMFDSSLLPADSLNNTTSSSQTTSATGDAASLAKQVLANSNITLSDSAKADITAASNNQKVTPGPIGDGSSGLPGCSARTPTNIDPGLLKTMLSIAQKYKYQINDIVSGHDCDTGKHPVGRAMDIFYIEGKPLNDSWWSSSSNVAVIDDIGNIVHNTGTYQFGFGVGCSAVSKIQSRGNLVVFNDSCGPQDEIHIDVRGAP